MSLAVSHQRLLSEWVAQLGGAAAGRDSAGAAHIVGGDGADRQRSRPYAVLMHDWLRDRWGMQRHAEKRLARAVGCSPRTVENWLRGVSAPSGEQLLNLMAECDGLAEDILAEVRRRQRSRLP
jgi:hypothetical protein